MTKMRKRIYLFIRTEGFYPIELRNDDDARKNAECNPGTLRVEAVSGRVVWRKSEANR
jgi:hypothetical protein